MTDESTPTSSGAPPPRWALKILSRTHVLLHRSSGGRLFNTLSGDEVCFVTMKGARSGRMRTFPLMYVPHEGGVLLVASQGGAPKNPVWFNNLVENPEISVNYRGRELLLRARLAEPGEKAALWPICDSHYAPYAEYRARTSRDIPIFVCEPQT